MPDERFCLVSERISPRCCRREIGHAPDDSARKRLSGNFVLSAKLKKKNSYLLPPILRREILDAKPSTGDHVLVYVTSPSPDLAALLRQVRCTFLCYGFGRDGRDNNVTYKKPSAAEFLKDLASCKAVIANTGFSLVSEALHLGKPYLGVPVKHQFEQVFNAYYLEQSGYGPFWQDLNKERIESFLFNLDLYRQQLASYPRQDNSLLFAKLDQLIAQYTQRGTKVKSARV